MQDDFLKLFYSCELNDFVDTLMCDEGADRALSLVKSKSVSCDSRYCVSGADLPVLYIAVMNKKLLVADELIKAGARIDDYAESCGVAYSLVLYALSKMDYDTMAYFESKNADVRASASDGTDALYWASINGSADLIEKFLRMGYDTKKYYNGKNLIEHCCAHSSYRAIDILLSLGGMNINMTDPNMKTALFKAVEENNYDAVLYLLRNGADPNVMAYSDPLLAVVKPYDVARFFGYTRITRLLADPHKSYMETQSEFTLTTTIPEKPFAGVCSICDNRSDALVPLSGCSHSFCKECLHDWFQSLNSQHKPIVCPHSGCAFKCSIYDVKAVMSDEEVKKIEHAVLISYLALLEDFVWCPTPGCGCGMVVVKDGTGCANVTCPKCGVTFCTRCYASHAESSCRSMYDEISSNSWLKENTKECPSCKARIVKNGGCSHMRCSQCNYEFCWICMNKYTGRYTFGTEDPCTRA